jgi:hypothetical protein
MFSQSPKKLLISDGGLNGTASQPKGGIMSGLQRWKENRIRQEIYRVHLKHTDVSPSGAGLHGGNLQAWNGTSVLLLEQTPGTRAEKRIPNRREKNRLPWIIVRVALLTAGLWVYLGQFVIHR